MITSRDFIHKLKMLEPPSVTQGVKWFTYFIFIYSMGLDRNYKQEMHLKYWTPNTVSCQNKSIIINVKTIMVTLLHYIVLY